MGVSYRQKRHTLALLPSLQTAEWRRVGEGAHVGEPGTIHVRPPYRLPVLESEIYVHLHHKRLGVLKGPHESMGFGGAAFYLMGSALVFWIKGHHQKSIIEKNCHFWPSVLKVCTQQVPGGNLKRKTTFCFYFNFVQCNVQYMHAMRTIYESHVKIQRVAYSSNTLCN